MAVVATGFFDGVHEGHRRVLSRLVSLAGERREESVAVTFWPHPRTVLQQDARDLRLLSSLEEKKTLINASGVDRMEVMDFTREFSSLSTEDYLKMLITRYGATAVVLGYDNRIGHDCPGVEAVAEKARSLGLEAVIEPAYVVGGMAVSSTKIRHIIEAGDVKTASAMLGYDYSLCGVVVAGNRLGRTLGFPTANMKLYNPLKLIPGSGSYLVRVKTLGRDFYGMCNIGVKPTVSDGNALSIETNIFDFDEDIYGLDLRISFLARIRGERKFESLSALVEQLKTDRDFCRSVINI